MWTAVAIVVHVALSFDPSIHSRVVRSGAPAEASEIWRTYGVELEWGKPRAADLCLAAYVNRSGNAGEVKTGAVLGSAFVPEDAARGVAPIRIGFDALDALAQPSASLSSRRARATCRRRCSR